MIHRALPLFALAFAIALPSCSADQVQKRQEGMTDWYEKRQKTKSIRIQEQEKRDRMRWNRLMGHPIDDEGMYME